MAFSIPPPAVPLVITSILFTSIALTVVCSRLYTRVVVLQNAGADDYIILGSMAASIAFLISVFFQIKNGLGLPFATMPLENLQNFLQALWITIPLYNLSLTLTKISILHQYLRIFTTPPTPLLLTILLILLSLYGIYTFLGSLLMCIPIASFWDMSGRGKCMNKMVFWFVNASLNILSDVVILGVPMPLLGGLQVGRRAKWGLVGVFGLGGFVCITSIIRLRSLYEISIATDTSLEGVNAAIWSGIEINVAIICSSLPATKPLLGRIIPGLRSLTNSGNRSRSNMTTLSGGSDQGGTKHELGDMNSKGSGDGGNRGKVVGKDEIQVHKDVYVQRYEVPSAAGSGDLVEWSTDCYSESAKSEKKARSLRGESMV